MNKEQKGQELYKQWKNNPSQQGLKPILDHYKDSIQSAAHTYAGQNSKSSNVQLQAKVLAAKAVKSYDPKKKVPLKNYIFNQLRPLYRYASRQGTALTLPERAAADIRNIQDAENELRDRIGREPTIDELADYTNMSQVRIKKINSQYRPNTVMESTYDFSDDEDAGVYNPIVKQYDKRQAWIDYIYYDLDPISKKILENRLSQNPISNKQLAKKLKISPGAVSQRAAVISKRINEGL